MLDEYTAIRDCLLKLFVFGISHLSSSLAKHAFI